jgi:hypothetical protein
VAQPRFRVKIKGEDEWIVETNARDKAPIVMDPNNPQPFGFIYQLVHNACRRLQLPVPRDYLGFLEALEEDPEQLDDDDDDLLDPTSPDR